MSTTALEVLRTSAPAVQTPSRGLPIPWRDPQSVSKKQLAEYIASLEVACRENPNSPDLRTCLGIAHAMNLDVYRSMDALEAAVALDPVHFFAQMKYAELFYRLRALPRAEVETTKALNLAGNMWELTIAKNQLHEIRRMIREGTQKPEWNKSLKSPVFALVAIFAILSVILLVFK
jgi:hypothetical protein